MDYAVAAFTSTGYQIDNLWNIFMALHIGIFAALVRIRSVLRWYENTVLVLAYITFAIMHSRALFIDYNLLQSLAVTIASGLSKERMLAQGEILPPEVLRAFFVSNSFRDRLWEVLLIHAFGVAVVIPYLFMRQQRWARTKTDGVAAGERSRA